MYTDFLYLLLGLTCFSLATLTNLWSRYPSFAWRPLFLSFFLHGLASALSMLVPALGDSNLFSLARTIITLAAWHSLLEAGRRALLLQRTSLSLRYVWILTPIACTFALEGLASLQTAINLLVALPAALLVSWTLIKEARAARWGIETSLRLLSLLLPLFASSWLFQSGQGGVFASFVPFSVELVNILLIVRITLVLCIVLVLNRIIATLSGYTSTGWFLSKKSIWRNLIILIIISLSVFSAHTLGNRRSERDLYEIRTHAQAIASMLPADHITQLKFYPEETQTPVHARLSRHLDLLIRQSPGYNLAILLKVIGSKVLHGPGAAMGPEPLKPPGSIAETVPQAFWLAWSSRTTTSDIIVGKQNQHDCFWAPVISPRTRAVIAVIELHRESRLRIDAVLQARLAPLLLALFLSMALIISYVLLDHRGQISMRNSIITKYVEVWLVSGIGLILTIFFVILIQQNANTETRDVFQHLVAYRARILHNAMLARSGDLDSLDRYFSSSQNVSRADFNTFTKPLINKNKSIRQLIWAPYVPAAARPAFEAEARFSGITDYSFLGRNDRLELVTAEQRREYWPAHYIAPSDETLHLHGTDLSTDILSDEAMRVSAITRLRTATEPSRLFVDLGEEICSIFVFQPSSRNKLPSVKTDFVVAVIDPAEMLREALSPVDHERINVTVHLIDISASGGPRLVASWPDSPANRSLKAQSLLALMDLYPHYVTPVYAFGRSYAVVCTAGLGFIAAHSSQPGWVVGIVGTLLSTILAVFAWYLLTARGRAEEAVSRRTIELRQKTEELLLLSENIETQIWYMTDTETYGGSANRAHRTFLGKLSEKLVGKSIKELVPEESARTFIEGNIEAFASGRRTVREEWHTAPDGQARLLGITRIPRVGHARTVEYIICSAEDITIRRANEGKIEKLAERLTLASEATGVAIWDLDIASGKISYDSRIMSLYGLASLNEDLLAVWKERILPEDQAHNLRLIDLALSGEDEYKGDFVLIHPDGSKRHVEAKGIVIRDRMGNPVRMVGTNQDISERKRAEAMLKAREERFRILVENTPFPVLLREIDGTIIFGNKQALTFFETNPVELVGKNISQLYLSKETHAQLDKTLRSAGQLTSVETNLQTFRGTVFWCLISANTIEYDGKQVVLSTYHDITERRAAEASMKLAKEAAEAANKAKSEFLAHMSHEIRTPLNGIIGLSDLMTTTQLGEMQRQYLDNIRISAWSLLDVINDVLDFSRIESGKIEIEAIPFDMHETVSNALRIVSSKASEKGLLTEQMISPDCPQHLIGDPIRLRQILVNFLGNAIKFTKDGSILLKVEPGPSGMIDFSVSDTGIGIDPTKIHYIFESFSQADTSTTRQFGGTGLGLAISKRLASMMDGQILVKSNAGKGSKFTLRIPLPAAPANIAALEPQAGSVRYQHDVPGRKRFARSLSILLAEDNEINMLVAKGNLEACNCSVTTVSNGEEAVALASQQNFDLIFMDIHMPKLDGREATRAIRHNEAEQGQGRTPIIALTADAISGEEQRCAESGMDGYVTKPFRPDQLISVLERHLGENAIPVTDIDINNSKTNLSTTSIFDSAALSALLHQDRQAISTIIGMFVNTWQDYLTPLEEGIANQDYESVIRHAHRLKGATGNLRADELYGLAKLLEEQSRAQLGLDTLHKTLQSIKEAWTRLEPLLTQEINGGSG